MFVIARVLVTCRQRSFISRSVETKEVSRSEYFTVSAWTLTLAFRFAGTAFRYNADMDADAVERFCPLDTRLAAKMRMVYEQLGMSARSYHKTLKMARTIADLEGRDSILERDLLTAVGFRVSGYGEDEETDSGAQDYGVEGPGPGENGSRGSDSRGSGSRGSGSRGSGDTGYGKRGPGQRVSGREFRTDIRIVPHGRRPEL